MNQLVTQLKSRAADFGFALSGVAPATDADGFDRFAAWLDRGYAGEMGYLHKHRDQRRHPASILDGVRSVVMLGMEYGHESPGTAAPGRVAKYNMERINFSPDLIDAACSTYFISEEQKNYGAKVTLQ